MIPVKQQFHGAIGAHHAVGDQVWAGCIGDHRFRSKRGDRGDGDRSEMIGALPPDIQCKGPHQPPQRQGQAHDLEQAFERRHGIERRILAPLENRFDLGQRHFVRGAELQEQRHLLVEAVADDGRHGDALRQLVKMRPRPAQIICSQPRLFPRHQAKGLGHDRRPAGAHRQFGAGLNQTVEFQRARNDDQRHRKMHQVDHQLARHVDRFECAPHAAPDVATASRADLLKSGDK